MILMASTSLGSISQLFTVLAIFLLVVFLAWFSTRFIAKYQKAGARSGGNMEVIEALRLSQTQVVEILRIGDRYIAVAISKDSVTKLGEWHVDDIDLMLPEQVEIQTPDFMKILKRVGAGKDNGEGVKEK